MIENEVYIDHEVYGHMQDFDIPVREQSPGSLHVMIKHHERNVHRFMEWLESEGLTICKGAMPQSDEKVKARYHEFQYARRGLCVPSAS